MNPNYTEFKFPMIKAQPWQKVFMSKTDPLAISLVSQLLIYDPLIRKTPYDALKHEYFDELRQEKTLLPNGNPLPDLFNFTDSEREFMGEEAHTYLLPEWYKAARTQK